jgi:hypothetical protein
MTEFETASLALLKSIDESLKVLRSASERNDQKEKAQLDMSAKMIREGIDRMKK